ncbi:MAG TPA: glycosyltransferase family 4 protein [Fimbriiglobus sp.]|nr:glycosyltransferase family 4 protein [Fimbriiglobus sp.]
MFILIDGLPLQTSSPRPDTAELLAGLRDARPDWRLEVTAHADRPPPDDLAGLPIRQFHPPLPDTADNRPVLDRYYADWLDSQHPNWVLHADLFGPERLVPVYRARQVRAAAIVRDVDLPTDSVETSSRLRTLAAMDLLLTDAIDVDRLLGPDAPPVVDIGPASFGPAADQAETAERVAVALERTRRVPAGPRRPRVAWVAPAPPAQSGIADYAAEVAAVLSDRFDLEWVSDPNGPPPDPDACRTPIIPADRVEARHAVRPYDLFVYHVGNSYYHSFQLPLLARHPGLVVLHDVALGHLFRWANEAGVWPGTAADEAAHNGDTQLADWLRADQLHPHAAQAFSPLSRRVLESAAAVVVHSRGAWQQVRRATDAPTVVVPHIATTPAVGERAAERLRLGLPADRFLVCSLGIVGPPKRIAVLVRAVAGLPPDVRRWATVLLVGPCEPEYRREIEALACELGLRGQVSFVGRVPLDDFPAYAVAADVCVQLRYPSNWETSGSLVRALAAGAACVTSDTGSMLELPNAVALKVRSPARDVPDLTAALTRLARDPALRDRLGDTARRYVAETHAPEVVAAGYAAAVGHTIAALAHSDAAWRDDTLNALADLPGGPPPGLIDAWAELRTQSIHPEAEPLPDIPVVPAAGPLKRRAS